jgi:hypothetical protein
MVKHLKNFLTRGNAKNIVKNKKALPQSDGDGEAQKGQPNGN